MIFLIIAWVLIGLFICYVAYIWREESYEGNWSHAIWFENGFMPNLVLRPLPRVTPIAARGEFVRETVRPSEPDAASAGWQVEASLTKGQVDTYLFLRFPTVEPH